MGLQNFIEENIRFEILFVMWIFYFWKLYMSLRQRKLMTSLETPPSSLDGLMPLEDYQKARSYALEKNAYTNYLDLYSTIIHTVFILAFAHHYFWQWGIRLIEFIDMRGDDRILAGMGCMVVLNSVITITHLPFEVYNVFFLEQKHGINKQTPRFFVTDQFHKFAMMQVKHLPHALLTMPEGTFYPKVWLVCTIVMLCKSVLYPEVIAPFWEKYTPLPEGKLKEGIESLAASVDFPLYKVYIVDGSKRSSDNNVKAYGFSKNKRIVLLDTVVKGLAKPVDGKEDQGCEDDEVVSVIAHEVGHWKYGHWNKRFLMTQIILVTNLLLANLLHYNPMYVAFGFTDTRPVFIGITILMTYILDPVSTVTGFLQNVHSWRCEFQADQFVKKLGHAEPLKRALVKLRKDKQAYPVFDLLYSNFHHSHPPLLECLRALDKTE